MNAMHHILMVGCGNAALQSLARQLALYDEFPITRAGTGQSAFERLRRGSFAALVVAGPLPDLDEAAFCRQARQVVPTLPLVALGSGDDAAIIRALDAGALDYVVLPVRANVLMARLRAHLRLYERSENASLALGRYLLNARDRRLVDLDSGAEMLLTGRETDLLKYLHRAGGRSVSQDELLTQVWGYYAGTDTHTVQTHVHRLRRKIGDQARRSALIVTEGRSYRLASDEVPRGVAA